MTEPTPGRHRPARSRSTRSRTARRLAAAAGVCTALGVLAAPALTAPTSTAADLAFPYVEQFDTAAGGTLHGDAQVAGGRLRLTDDAKDQAGAWSTDDTFASDLGLEIEFTYAMYTDQDDPGADGLVLFLADGAAAQGVGSFGGGLGYACRRESTQGGGLSCDLPGVPGGFAGVAIDHYGNFSAPINYSGPGPQPDSVVVRGSGDGVTGYRYVDAATAPGGTLTDGRTTRTVRVTLVPGDDGELALTVRLEAGGALRTVLDQVPLHGDGQAPLPPTLRLGFAAATGSHVDVHEIDSLRVWQPANLAVEQEMPASVAAGDDVEYAVTARNVGPNASAPSALAVDVPDDLHDVSWTCAADSGSACGSDAGTGDVTTDLDLPRDGSATITVSGTLDAGATGTVESTATITPEPSLADVDESDNTSTVSAPVTAADTTAQLETDKSVTPSDGVAPGDEVEYLVTARNRGPADAADVGAVDELPEQLRFVGSPDDCTAEGQRVSCRSDTTLASGESVSFRIRAVLDPEYRGDGSDVVNTAVATSPSDPDGGDPSPGVSIGVVGPGGGPVPSTSPIPAATPSPTGRPTSGPDTTTGPDTTVGPATTPTAVPAAGAQHGGTGGGTRSARLAFTGVEDLGRTAALGAGALAVGGIGWWALRRHRRRSADADGTATDDDC
ncbi:hypothetical protein Csp2054_16020 [Curtobacterium sp. 'Ferrero']|uniref:lectin-like domain-containing protein n=1 Tax=Curtobacterium sp. 'Ferrero' TaxID=2033654 RepID=UPI000BCF315A|nr:DUF11 domain-containing protein [Curtobacterium sp. 'Ferrero']PCN46668.1 hypothetical protein Csp2054_16020 [Curtobacterium sp. 'Ferrero']